MACWVGIQGQVNLATRAKTCSYYDVTQRKPHTQNEKKKFSIWTRRLSESVEGLNSSPTQSAGK